jgi:hypothetical protein
MSSTGRFQLPFILPGQAQKELYHNEALTRIDAALHAAAEEAPLPVPPEAPQIGQSWLVAAGASGQWEQRDGQLATWTEGGWRFVAPQPGMMVWVKTENLWRHWNGHAWGNGDMPAARLVIGDQQVVGERQPAIISPSGGTTIDEEARAAVAAVIATLMSHGLID